MALYGDDKVGNVQITPLQWSDLPHRSLCRKVPPTAVASGRSGERKDRAYWSGGTNRLFCFRMFLGMHSTLRCLPQDWFCLVHLKTIMAQAQDSGPCTKY